MGERVELYVLAVGQGSCNLVATYDENDRMSRLDLYDCGNSGGIDGKVLREQMNFIHEKMRERAEVVESAASYYLDNVIVSHGDQDHLRFFSNLYFFQGFTATILDEGKMISIKTLKEAGINWPHMHGYVYACEEIDHECGDPKKIEVRVKRQVIVNKERGELNFFYCGKFNGGGSWWSIMTIRGELLENEKYKIRWRLDIDPKRIQETRLWKLEYFYISCESDEWKFRCEISIRGIYSKELTTTVEISDKATQKIVTQQEFCGVISFFNESLRALENPVPKLVDLIKTICEELPDEEMNNRIDGWLKCMDLICKEAHENLSVINYNLIESFLNEEEGKKTCEIKNVYFGGSNYSGSVAKKTAYKMLSAYSEKDIMWVVNDVSHYDYVCGKHRVLFRVFRMPRNFLWKQKKYSFMDENSGSLAYEAKDSLEQGIIFLPGDPTGDTMWYMSHKRNYNMPQNVWMTAPHHGSYETCRNSKLKKRKKFDKTILRDYLQKLKPTGIIISAGYKNKYGHPNREFIQIASRIVSAEKKEGESYIISADKSQPRGKRKWVIDKVGVNLYANLMVSDDATKCNYLNWKVVFEEGDFKLIPGDILQTFEGLPTMQQKRKAVDLNSCNGEITPTMPNEYFEFILDG